MEFSRQEYWSGLPSLLQGIFSTQGLNLGLLCCRQILYHLSHQRSPYLFLYVYIYINQFSCLWEKKPSSREIEMDRRVSTLYHLELKIFNSVSSLPTLKN